MINAWLPVTLQASIVGRRKNSRLEAARQWSPFQAVLNPNHLLPPGLELLKIQLLKEKKLLTLVYSDPVGILYDKVNTWNFMFADPYN